MSEEKSSPVTTEVRDKLPDPRDNPRDNPKDTLILLGLMRRGRPSTGQPELEGIDFARGDFPAHPTVNTK